MRFERSRQTNLFHFFVSVFFPTIIICINKNESLRFFFVKNGTQFRLEVVEKTMRCIVRHKGDLPRLQVRVVRVVA